MTLGWQDLQRRYKAEFVGGELIARIDGKHQSLARKKDGKVILTPFGKRLAADLAPAVPASTPTRRRAPRKKVETPDAQA